MLTLFKNAVDKWQIVFWIVAGIVIVSMVVFIIGGSADIQKWNDPKSQESQQSK